MSIPKIKKLKREKFNTSYNKTIRWMFSDVLEFQKKLA